MVARCSTAGLTASDDARASLFTASAADAAAAALLTSRGPALMDCTIANGTSLDLVSACLRSSSFSCVSF